METPPFYFQQPFCQLATGCRVVEVDPPKDLAPFVAKLGYINIVAPYIRQKVPDGCFGVAIGIHEKTGITRSFVFGPGLMWGHWPLSPGWTYMDARLRWGTGMRFLCCSPEDLGPLARPGEDVFGSYWKEIAERARDEKTARDRMLIFIDGLRKVVQTSAELRPDIARTVDLMEQHNPWLTVDDLAEAACLSASQLRRLFAKELGASPKELLRLSRLWWSMKLALTNPDLPWGAIAADAGFSDQAHLVGEYRHFTGSTPRNWHLNLYGVQPVTGVVQSARPA